MRITDSPAGLPSLLDEYNLFEFSNPLLPHHRELLALAGVAPDIADARGVISCSDPADITALGFSQTQAAAGLRAPVLLFRIWNVDGGPAGWQMRPDTPRVGSNGRVVKYETPAGAKTTLDIHPFAFKSLRDAGTPLLVTEGVKKADAVLSAARREGVAICPADLSGVNMAKTPGTEAALGSIPLTNRTVFIGFDSDAAVNEAVNKAAIDLGRSLQGRGAVVRFILLDANREGGKVGLDDALASGTTLAELLAGAVESIDPVRPVVAVSARIDQMVARAVKVLAREDGVFVTGDRLAYVRQTTSGRKGTLVARIEPFSMPSMRTLLAGLVDWRTARGTKEPKLVAARPPDDVVAGVLAPQDWPDIQRLDLVTHAPSLLPDLTVTTRGGYYAAGRLLYKPRIPLKAIPKEPTHAECKAALEVLLEPFSQFPFMSEADRSGVVAAVLTLVAEPAVGGNIPIVAFDGNSPGCGKGMLTNIITRIGIDAPAALITGDMHNEEAGKLIPSLAVSGQRVVVIDNVTDEIRLPALDSAITTGHITHRILRTSETRTIPCRLVFFLTGNGLAIGGDAFRRTLFIRLRTTVERPEERSDFRHQPLEEWVERNLADLQAAAATILRGFVAAGMPQQRLSSWGSFEEWSCLIRQCVVWTGLPDPLETRADMRAVTDPMDAARRTLVSLWPTLDPNREGLLARQAIALLTGPASEADPDLKEAVESLCRETRKTGTACPTANQLGYVLSRLKTRPYESGGVLRWIDKGEGNSKEGIRWHWFPRPEEVGETPEVTNPVMLPTHTLDEEEKFQDVQRKTPSPSSPSSPHLRPKLDLITTYDDAMRLLGVISEGCSQGMIVGVTLEPEGLSPLTSRPRLLQIAASDRPVAAIDLDRVGGLPALAEHLRPLRAVAHNAVSEMGFLRHHGGLALTLDCTLLAEHVLTGKSRSLADVLRDRLGLLVEGKEELQASDWSGALSPEQLQHAAANAEAARQLFPVLQSELERLGATRAYELARDAQPAVVSMALAGVPIDHEDVERRLAEIMPQQAAVEARASAIFGADFNIRSSTQLEQLLIEGLPPEMTESWPRTPRGALETGTKVLAKYIPDFPEPLRSHFRNVILPYRALQPLEQALPPYDAHRVYPHMNVLGASTGRMSCSKPNVQALPKTLRSLVRAPEGHRLIMADYSQIEFLIAAVLAGEQRVLDAFECGEDVHVLTAKAILGRDPGKQERQTAKAANYGLLYGQGAAGFRAYASQTYGVSLSPDEAARVRESWFAAYPKIRKYQNRLMEEWQGGRLLQSPMGRPLYPTKYTEALNYPAQAAGAEIIHAALGLVHRNLAQFGGRVVPILAVHDEIVLLAPVDEADAAARVLEESMTEAALSVLPDLPSKGLVEAKVVVTWADKG
jgi:DNA polymerase I